MSRNPLPRLVDSALRTHLGFMPAVVVTGARQTGKSTLAEALVPAGRSLLSLDDLDVVDALRANPEQLLAAGDFVALDEVQREPAVLLAIKRMIDKQRQPGRFLLTGSANLLLMRRVSETLAGRASYLTLWPMTRREQMGLGRCGIWEDLLAAPPADWRDVILSERSDSEDWRALARRGGFPVPALQLAADHRQRGLWFDGYVRTYLERDLQQLANITALADFRRLMRAAALRLGQLVNQTEIGRDIGLPQATVRRHLNLLETSYLLIRLPAFAANRTKRLIKAPKLYWGDVGLAIRLAGEPDPAGAHLENIVLHDLLAWRDSRPDSSEIFHWRTAGGEEVDFVAEAGQRLLPIEIKAKAQARLRDARGLLAFQSEHGDRARPGLLLHDGESVEWIAPAVLAAPWWRVV